jgi:hypothetical protein
MKLVFRVMLLPICLSLVAIPLAQVTLADRGMVPIGDVSVYGPGQKAIIAWNGDEEVMILSTDVSASGDSQVLEVLPLPSEPKVEKGDFASFEQVSGLIEEHFSGHWWDGFRKGALTAGEGVEIVFHEKIGAHDITVVKAGDSAELVMWAESFLRDAGIEHEISSPKLESLVGDYIARDIHYFVFDLIEVTSEPKSIEPIVYRFDSDFLYFPLKISTLAEGWTDINLFLLTPQPASLHWLPEGSELAPGLEMGQFYGEHGTQPIQFKLTEEELASISKDIVSLLESDGWLTAMAYHGDLSGLTRDLIIGRISPDAKLVLDCCQGRCTAEQESQAVIGTFGNTIVAYGLAITPTPCYELAAELTMTPTFAYPPTMIINITAQEKPGFCIECLGEVLFRAETANLVPGLYDIVVQYQGKVIGQERVYLPLSSVSQYFQLPAQATLRARAHAGQLEVYLENGSEVEALKPGTVVKASLRGSDMKLHSAYLQFNEASSETWFEVGDMPAILKVAPNRQLKIQDRQLFLETEYRPVLLSVMPNQAAGSLEVEPRSIELKVVDDRAVYEIQGVTHEQFWGFTSKEIRVEGQVDATTGEVVERKLPFFSRPSLAKVVSWLKILSVKDTPLTNIMSLASLLVPQGKS